MLPGSVYRIAIPSLDLIQLAFPATRKMPTFSRQSNSTLETIRALLNRLHLSVVRNWEQSVKSLPRTLS